MEHYHDFIRFNFSMIDRTAMPGAMVPSENTETETWRTSQEQLNKTPRVGSNGYRTLVRKSASGRDMTLRILSVVTCGYAQAPQMPTSRYLHGDPQ